MDSPHICTMKTAMRAHFLIFLIVACCCREVSSSGSRLKDSFSSAEPDLVHDSTEKSDIDIVLWHSKLDGLHPYRASTESTTEPESCQKYYFYLPCSDNWRGGLFLFLVYGFILWKAVDFLSEGSDLLSSECNTGAAGGICIPLVKILPTSFLIFVTILATTKEEARVQAQVGVGLLSGTNIILLCLVWGGSVVAGNRKGLGGEVLVGEYARKLSWITAFTVLPYLVVQIPVTFGWSPSSVNFAMLAAFMLSLIGLGIFWIYQVFWSVSSATSTSQLKRRVPKISLEDELPFEDGELNKLFDRLDTDNSDRICKKELRALIFGYGIKGEFRPPSTRTVDRWMADFDVVEVDGLLSREEFVKGMKAWQRGRSLEPVGNFQPKIGEEDDQEINLTVGALKRELREELEQEAQTSNKTNTFLAVIYLSAGVAIAALASVPVVGVVGNFSEAVGISPLFVSFVAIPLLLHLGDGISYVYAARKNRNYITTAFDEIYKKLAMTNTLALAIFLAVAYYKALTWNFLPEVLMILISYLVMVIITSVRNVFPAWIGLLALLLYPVSIAVVVISNLSVPAI
ncbi:hypothetical protein Mapa_017224 [Marchantia paleacea]|nr:hypothetical protein Mapa_017224 [Marchantia paleacea]